MSSQHSTVRRVGGPVAASLTILALVVVNTAAPVGAQSATTTSSTACSSTAPVLDLANPRAGDVLSQGNIVISGDAFVPSAAPLTGVSRVDLFLGSRDNGGLFIGSTVPVGKEFQVTADVPNSENGGRDFVAYAYAMGSGQETSVSVPVFIGAAPTATPTGSTTVVTPVPASGESSSCPAITTAAAAPAPAMAQAPATAPAMATEGVPFVQLANPGSGDLLPTGDIVITGAAWDPAATSGSGIDRVELYLDPRENGGLFLGSVEPTANTFTLTIKVPNSANGGHTLTAYARSSVTGHEAVEQVPVNVGVAPTPTPRPSTNS